MTFIREMPVKDLRVGDIRTDNNTRIVGIRKVTELGGIEITYQDLDGGDQWTQLDHYVNHAYRIEREDT
jgi:hypothetical protein